MGWLVASGGATAAKFTDFLERHGHRGYRELCVRDPSWGDDPEGLGTIMQAMLRARLATGNETRPTQTVDDADLPRALRTLARMARAGARGREATKSRMVLVAHRLSRGYRLLGEQLAAIGRLPDADLVFFFDRSELPAVVGIRDISELVAAAESRRTALPFQARLEFPDVSVGKPVPFQPSAARGHRGRRDRRPAGLQRRRRGHGPGRDHDRRGAGSCSPGRSWWRR